MVVGMLLLWYLIHGRLFFLPSQFKKGGEERREKVKKYIFI
jgi:hypothetical protein